MTKKPASTPDLTDDFAKALRDGTADAAIVEALYKSATGYSHEGVKIFQAKEGGELVVPYTEHYAPYFPAIVFWLTNRMGDEWKPVKGTASGAPGPDADIGPSIKSFGNGAARN